jgi:phenylacetate-CoA ligase
MPPAGEHYDRLETRPVSSRRKAEARALARQVAHAKAHSPYYRALLEKIDPAAITSRKALAQLPVTRKSALAQRQRDLPPLGGYQGVPLERIGRYYQSPGPVYEADGRRPDHWRFARSLWAAGMRPGELIHNSFSYHLTPAGNMVESAAEALSCPVFPGGVGNTELQLQAMMDLRPAAYCGTPSFLKILLDKGRELGRDVSSVKKALVGGEALPPSLRAEFADRGVAVFQNYGTADLGLIAYESSAREGLIVDEGVIVEIARPDNGEPLPDGEVGEVLVTVLDNDFYPLLRFATGDLSAIMPGVSPCGRTNRRLRGWLGRADQATKVKGMFVVPAQIAQVLARHPEVRKARLDVASENNADIMTLHCEVDADRHSSAAIALAAAIADTVQSVCKVRGHVEIVAPGSLPNDGKVIADLRKYD